MKKLEILILDDVIDDVELVVIELGNQGFQFNWRREYTAKGLMKALDEQDFDLIISDYMMQGFNGAEALEIFKTYQLNIPFIIISGTVGEDIAVETMRQGAHDYIMKDNLARLGEAIKRELRDADLRRSHEDIKENLYYREAQLNSVFSASPVGIGIIKDRVIQFANKRFAEIIGYTNEEITGQPSTSFYLNADEYRKVGTIYEQLKTSKLGSVEAKLLRKDGKTIEVKIQLSQLDQNQIDKGYTFTVDDITDKVKNEKLKFITYRISELANTSEDLPTMLVTIRDILSSIIDTTNFYVALYNEHDDLFNLPFFTDEKDKFDTIPAGKTLTKYVIEQNKPILLTDREIRQLESDGKINRYASPSKCWLGVPLHDENKIVGVLGVQSYKNEHAYNDDDKELLTFISDQIAASIRLRKSQDDLVDSEQKYRVLADAANEAIFVTDGDICIETNKKASEMFGYTHSELIGLKSTEIVSNDYKELLAANMKSGNNEPYEANALRKDGSVFPALFHGRMFEFLGKSTQITTVLDLTKEKRNESRLKSLLQISQLETETDSELFDFTINKAIELTDSKIGLIYLYEESSKIFELNSWSSERTGESMIAPQRIFNLEKAGVCADIIQDRKAVLLNAENIEARLDELKTIGLKNLKNFLSIPVIIDGTIKAIAAVGNKSSSYDETDTTQLSLLLDAAWKVLERKQHFNQLKEEKNKAQQADHLKSAFLANMSHEIRTPMNGILGFSDILSLPHITELDKQECLDQIKVNGRHLLRIIDDLIDISLIESDRLNMMNEEFDIKQIIQEQALQLQKSVLEKNSNISVVLSIPDSEKIVVKSDPDRVRQIILNLLNNAEKFTKTGFIECGYNIVANNTEIEIFVKDTGIGIPKDKLDIIFERFRQVDDSYNRKYGGTGLGLSIVKHIIDKLGSKIVLESTEGEGSTFSFRLPILKLEEKKSNTAGKATSEELDFSLFNGKKIMVVEDSATNVLYIRKTLSNKGLEIIWAGDGVQAINSFHKNPDLDLILMDINLPNKNGIEATKEIRNFNKEVKIIAQTAFVSPKDIKMCLAAGCNSYVAKPFNQKTFLKAIIEQFEAAAQ